MKLTAALKKHGIIITPEQATPGVHDVDCPKKYCKDNRASMGDTDPCLRLEVVTASFAKWRCRHCLDTGHVGDDPAVIPPSPEPVAQLPDPGQRLDGETGALPSEIIEYFDALGIPPQIIEDNSIRWREDLNAIGFPYFDTGGGVTNMMLLHLPEQTTRLATARSITLYGLEKIQIGAEVVIVQDEIARMIFQACGIENTVTIPNGGNVPTKRDDFDSVPESEYLAHAADILGKAHRIVIATDNTPEGDKIRHEITRRVGAAKCFNVKFARGTARRTYRELGIDALCEDVKEAAAHPIRGLYEVRDFHTQLMNYFQYGMKGGVSTGFENVDELLTIATSRLTVVTGMPNNGKSEFVDAVTVNLSEQYGWRHGVFSPENGKEAHTVKLIEKRVMQPADPRSSRRMSEETFLSGEAWVEQHYYFIFSDIMEEAPTLDWILSRAADAVLRYGIKTLIIDPWNRIQKNLGSKSETDYVAEALAQILRFCANHDVHVFLVAHPAKQEPDRKTGLFPVPSLYSIAGSAHFVNMCDNGIVVHRKPGADNVTEIHIKKVRFKHEGETGVSYLVYNKETGRYAPREEPDAIYSQAGGFPPSEEDDAAPVKTWEAK